MSEQINVTMIVAAAVVTSASTMCSQLAGEAGSNMFTTPLSTTGQLPATHYISAGFIASYLYDAMLNPQMIVDMSNDTITLPQITALLSQCDVSLEYPAIALARLNLHLIQGAA